jgi:hypothetical protein
VARGGGGRREAAAARGRRGCRDSAGEGAALEAAAEPGRARPESAPVAGAESGPGGVRQFVCENAATMDMYPRSRPKNQEHPSQKRRS